MGIARIIVVSGRFGEKIAFSQCRALEGDAGSNVPIRRMAWPDGGRAAGSGPPSLCVWAHQYVQLLLVSSIGCPMRSMARLYRMQSGPGLQKEVLINEKDFK